MDVTAQRRDAGRPRSLAGRVSAPRVMALDLLPPSPSSSPARGQEASQLCGPNLVPFNRAEVKKEHRMSITFICWGRMVFILLLY